MSLYPLSHPCPKCGAKPHELCRNTPAQACDERWPKSMTNQRDAAEAVARIVAYLREQAQQYKPDGDMRFKIEQLAHSVETWEHLASLPAAIEREPVAMTREEHHFEYLKQMAAYTGPVVSFDVREPYYLASCDACGWVGSSELCGTDSWGDDSDVYCPRCQASGADCGKVADRIPAPSDQEPEQVDCGRCCGNGELVSDWGAYLRPPEDAPPEAGTMDCPDCDGRGTVDAPSDQEKLEGWRPIETAPKEGWYAPILTCCMGEPVAWFGHEPVAGYAEPPSTAYWNEHADCWTPCQRPHDAWEPTHWMPVPDAPITRARQNGEVG